MHLFRGWGILAPGCQVSECIRVCTRSDREFRK